MIGDPDDPTTDDVLAALSQVGQQDVDASPERLDALEARIMERIDHDRRPVVAGVGPAVIDAAVATRRRWPARLVAVAAALLTFAVAFGVLSNDDDGLVIAAADAVVVMLPDGERVPGRAGTELPDGTNVEVAGFVDVDGRRYGPGRYRVADGQLVGEADSATGLVEPDADVAAPTRSDDVSTSSPTSTPTANPTSTAPSEPPLAERTTVPDVASPRPATTVLPTRPATTTTTTTPIRPTTTTIGTRPTITTPTRPTTTPPTTTAPTTSVAVRPVPPQSTAVPQTATTTTTTTTTTSTVPPSTTAPARSPAAVPTGPPVRVDR